MANTSNIRQEVLLKIASNGKIKFNKHTKDIASDYGINTFNDKEMREYLPKDTYKKLCNTIRTGEKIDPNIANTVAHAMKEWAISKGVSHFTHWFQPQTGLTAEKHDAFLEFDDGKVIERFRGNQLVQGEPDASSFPSGGSRTTFEARGYTMWDPSSPAFIMEGPNGGILCIPSVFISFTGEALDKKTPLLRSMEATSKTALRVLRLFGCDSVHRVITTIGIEQEYFLIDKAFYNLRPDLQLTSRTLQGASSPKGQQLDDHYFGSIKERVLAFMQDSEHELYKLSVPAKTRHNEVAPHQFELAPIYDEANVGADRNQITMEVLKKVASRHGLALLLHEKPFAGINGSGKHNNWSMADTNGNNLLDPGETPEENLQFLIFLVATLKAVHTHGALLRMSIASTGNDHRLGANEAPPAIISVFLGQRLTTILDDIRDGKTTESVDQYMIDLGLSKLPPILRDNTDRNRTSPFAFTGQKFEFRALGSASSVSLATTVLSGAFSEAVDLIMDEIDEKIAKKDSDRNKAILTVLKKYIKNTDAIRFEGNNYSTEWEEEAKKRGLPNVKKTGYALDAFVSPSSIKMFKSQKIFSENEIYGRYNTKLEQYITNLEIEAETLIDLLNTRVLPPALTFKSELLSTILASITLDDSSLDASIVEEKDILANLANAISNMLKGVKELEIKLKEAEKVEDLSEKAKFFADNIANLIEEIRIPADTIEKIVPDSLWTLPKYSEMLFIM